jgi:hypothetical protein
VSESAALTTFRANLASLEDLVRFDDRIIDVILVPLERLQERLVAHGTTNHRLLPGKVIHTLKHIRANESLKAHYRALHNQWLVLLVSYFGAAVRDLFVESVALAIRDRSRPTILKELLEVPIEDLVAVQEDSSEFAAELLASGKDLSFQDMQSIGRAFQKYFGLALPRDAVVNDIITSQACRHAIVHSAGVADRRMVSQLRNATPRTIKQSIATGEHISFAPAEIKAAAEAMLLYLGRLDTGVRETAI